MSTEITRTEQAYISLIRSRLEYCAAVWNPYLIKDINILEGIQQRAARFVMQDHSRFTSVSSLLKDLNWAPLKDRRWDIRLAMLFKIPDAAPSHALSGGHTPHHRDTRKWSDDYWTRTRTRWSVGVLHTALRRPETLSGLGAYYRSD